MSDAPSRGRAAHSRAAGLVERVERIDRDLAALFAEVAEVVEACRAEGSLWGGPVYPPMVEAAYLRFREGGPVETRIELERIGPPPILEWVE